MHFLKKYLDRVLKAAKAFLFDQTQRLIIASRPADENALVILNVQEKFCDPKYGEGSENTDEIAKRIKRLTPEFRKAGISVYLAYSAKDVENAHFYKVRPGRDDKTVEAGKFAAALKRDGKKSLFLCGFNLNAAIRDAAMEARKQGLGVCILNDLTGNDRRQKQGDVRDVVREMRQENVRIAESSQVLRDLSCNINKILPQ